MPALTYAEVGAVRYSALHGEPLPSGYAHLRVQVRLGKGDPARLERAGDALLGWQVHRSAGVRVAASEPQAERGVTVTCQLGVGPVRIPAPCIVVFTVHEPTVIGFGYGTLPGHPETGEEAFLVELHGDELWFTVTAFSRPAVWYTWLAGPLLGLFQRAYAHHLGRTLRRLLKQH